MTAEAILRRSKRDPAVMVASVASNLLALAVPVAMIQIYDRVIPNQATETLAVLAMMVYASVAIEALLRLARGRLLLLASERFERAAYRDAVWALLTEDPAGAGGDDRGGDFARLAAIERLRGQHAGEKTSVLLDLPFAALFLGVVMLLSPLMGATVLALIVASLLVLRASQRRIVASRAERMRIEARRHSFVSEALRGIDTIKGLRAEGFMKRRNERLLERSANVTAEITRRVQHAQAFTTAVGTLAPVATATIGAFIVLDGQMTVGALAAVILLTGRIVQPVLQVVSSFVSSESARMSLAEYNELVSLPRRLSGTTPLARVETVELADVAVEDVRGEGAVLAGLDLTLRAGDVIDLRASRHEHRIVFMRLVLSEAARTAGEVRINGEPAEGFRLEDRQSRIRMLTYESRLLEGTLLDNLAAFRPEIYRDRAVELAGRLGLEGFILQSPDGLATRVSAGEQGRLPHSMRRIALNVAGLVTDPDVILFDQANAGLDHETDRLLLSWLAENSAGRIVVLASERPSYRAIATRVIDLDDYLVAPADTDGQAASAETRPGAAA